MIRPIFAANWKMNHTASDAQAFMRTFRAHYPRRSDRTVIFFPSALALQTVVAALQDRPEILVGVQNIYWEPQGAFTGENSAGQARDAGARVVLVGHSERRHVFGESDEDTAKKCAAAARAGLAPMLCVGEKIEEREQATAREVVVRQLRVGLSRIDSAHFSRVALAYEPVWAIGTGRNATPGDAAEMHAVIRSELISIAGAPGRTIPVLYGGSVNRGNARDLLNAPGVDGLLVGGASLDAEGWSSLTNT